MVDDIKSAKDIGFPSELNIMLYGEFAGGKTTFGLTFPKPIFVFDLDKRYQTFAGMAGVDFKTYEDTGRRPSAYRDFMKDLLDFQEDSEQFETVLIDSSTSLLDVMTNDLLGTTGTGRGATEGLDLSQWGTVNERFRKIFTLLKGYDAHTILTSHQQIFQDDLTGEIKYVTMLVGRKLPQKAPLFFDEVYRCYTERDREKGTIEYLIQTQSGRHYPARTSLNLRDEEQNTIPILDPVEPQDYKVIERKIKAARENPEEFIKEVKARRESSK